MSLSSAMHGGRRKKRSLKAALAKVRSEVPEIPLIIGEESMEAKKRAGGDAP